MRVIIVLTGIIGIIQGVTGVLALTFACVLNFNLFDIQSLLNIDVEAIPFHLMLLFAFGIFSIISGLFLVHEWLERSS
jgi:hypothetical protein